MIAKQLIRRNEQANRLSVCGTNNVFFTRICAKSLCKYLRDGWFVSVDCVCMEQSVVWAAKIEDYDILHIFAHILGTLLMISY